MKKLFALWQLMRLEHGIMIAIAILIGTLVATQALPTLQVFLFTFFTALFLEASTFVLNDYLDRDIDTRNRRTDRPLVRGDLQPRTALLIFALLFPLGILSSYFVNLTCFLIALITALFAVVYDTVLKKIKLLGNFFIAYTMAIPFVFGGVAMQNAAVLSLMVSPTILVLASIAFLAGSGREIMKDVQDFKGDKEQGIRSFPRYLGTRGSNILAGVFYLGAITVSFLPYSLPLFSIFYQNNAYLATVFLADIIFLTTTLQLFFFRSPNLAVYRKFTLLGLMIGLAAFLIGAFLG